MDALRAEQASAKGPRRCGFCGHAHPYRKLVAGNFNSLRGLAGRDSCSAGLYVIKARDGIAIVQDPKEALTPNVPQNALKMVDIDFCLPVSQIADVLIQLTNGKATNITESSNGGLRMEDQASADRSSSEPPGDQIPFACPQCNGQLDEIREGELAHFECFVGHGFSPECLGEQHTEALVLHEVGLALPCEQRAQRRRAGDCPPYQAARCFGAFGGRARHYVRAAR